MITDFLKRRKEGKAKLEKFDKLSKVIKKEFKAHDETLNAYAKMSADDIERILNASYIRTLNDEWHVYRDLLKIIEGL